MHKGVINKLYNFSYHNFITNIRLFFIFQCCHAFSMEQYSIKSEPKKRIGKADLIVDAAVVFKTIMLFSCKEHSLRNRNTCQTQYGSCAFRQIASNVQ